MSEIKKLEKKLRRKIRQERYKTGSAVDVYNENVAIVDGAYKILHPTKGFRRNSVRRMSAALEGHEGMRFQINQVIVRAQKAVSEGRV